MFSNLEIVAPKILFGFIKIDVILQNMKCLKGAGKTLITLNAIKCHENNLENYDWCKPSQKSLQLANLKSESGCILFNKILTRLLIFKTGDRKTQKICRSMCHYWVLCSRCQRKYWQRNLQLSMTFIFINQGNIREIEKVSFIGLWQYRMLESLKLGREWSDRL